MYIVIVTVTRQRNAIPGEEVLTLKELFDASQQRWEKFPLVCAAHTSTERGGSSCRGWPSFTFMMQREKNLNSDTIASVCSGSHAHGEKNANHKRSTKSWTNSAGIKCLFGMKNYVLIWMLADKKSNSWLSHGLACLPWMSPGRLI